MSHHWLIRRWSTFSWSLAAVAVVSIVVLVLLFRVVGDASRADCERAVQGREDNRAMWDYLIAQSAPDNPALPAFRAELDERLPHLVCDSHNNPVPANR